MKIKIELDLEDFLTEEFDYDEETSTLRFKREEEVKDTIIDKIVKELIKKMQLNYATQHSLDIEVKKLVETCKDEIVDRVVRDVSNRIIKTKRIKEFKKQLESEDETNI